MLSLVVNTNTEYASPVQKLRLRLDWNGMLIMSVLHVKDGRPDLYSQKQIPNISGGNDVLKEVYL